MTMSVATRRQVDQILVRARQRFEAAERTAHRNDSQQGEFDNAYEGAVSGINFVVEAFLLATTGTRRKVGEDDAPTLIRSTCAGLSAKRIACPDPVELCWEQTRRNALRTRAIGQALSVPQTSNASPALGAICWWRSRLT